MCGLALGAPDLTVGAVAMVNLLGDLWTDGEPAWARLLGEPDARLHLYGKAAARPGRKMGHLTVLGDAPDAVATPRPRAARPPGLTSGSFEWGLQRALERSRSGAATGSGVGSYSPDRDGYPGNGAGRGGRRT